MEKKKTAEREWIDRVISEVEEDFERRQTERASLERQWKLNVNFLAGNQYMDISSRGEIVEQERDFAWQERQVYNHIAPIVESRAAKFSRVRPKLIVTPLADDDDEITNARLAGRVVETAFEKADFDGVVSEVTRWSEVCGTGFYKIVWDGEAGKKVGVTEDGTVFEGDIRIVAVSPFEIYPDCLYSAPSEVRSLIHARCVSAAEVFRLYGKRVVGTEVTVFGAEKKSAATRRDSVIVIERYELPNEDFPNGRMIAVGGGELLWYGELPYVNGENETRTFPFVRQACQEAAGCFFGTSVVERLIPVQRAYNAVKNRKHEFLNRLSLGVLNVEDGSLDTDDLAEDGLCPGKVLVYRQGSTPPEFLENGKISSDFSGEEEKLLNEFVIVSGVSDVTSASQNAKVTSGAALSILIEQDNSRLLIPAEQIRRAAVGVAKQALRLYRQFMTGVRLLKETDDMSKTKISYVDRKALTSDEVVLQSENELLHTPAEQKEQLFRLFESGLLTDGDGMLVRGVKGEILDLLGYRELDTTGSVIRLHRERAQAENASFSRETPVVSALDDHAVHVEEHTRYFLSEYERMSKEEYRAVEEHVAAHRALDRGVS